MIKVLCSAGSKPLGSVQSVPVEVTVSFPITQRVGRSHSRVFRTKKGLRGPVTGRPNVDLKY